MDKSKQKSKWENREEIKEQEKSDPGTTKGPDPQENMEGPISSLMHEIGDSFEDEDAERNKDEEEKGKGKGKQ